MRTLILSNEGRRALATSSHLRYCTGASSPHTDVRGSILSTQVHSGTDLFHRDKLHLPFLRPAEVLLLPSWFCGAHACVPSVEAGALAPGLFSSCRQTSHRAAPACCFPCACSPFHSCCQGVSRILDGVCGSCRCPQCPLFPGVTDPRFH